MSITAATMTLLSYTTLNRSGLVSPLKEASISLNAPTAISLYTEKTQRAM